MYRNICFTINNYTEVDLELILNKEKSNSFSYLIYGLEIGAGGTPHVQGYAELQVRSRLASVKKYLPRAHIEARLGTAEQASTYCKKDGQYEEFGIISKPGERTDLDKVRLIAETDGMRTVSAKFNLQQIRVAEKYLDYNEIQRDWKPHVIWLFGTTGTGKSRKARELLSDDTYVKNSGTKWWDGYDAHENIIIDDFRDSWWPITYMLALLDRYEFKFEVKGGHRQCLSKTIIITSAHNPKDCYRGTGEAINQLLRRIDVINELGSAVVPEVEEVIVKPVEHVCELLKYL